MEGILDYDLHYGRAPNMVRFVGYCDSDLAGDVDTSKSITGMMFFLGDCLFSWQSLKQKVVALSSCEAKYIATTTVATQAYGCQGCWQSSLAGRWMWLS